RVEQDGEPAEPEGGREAGERAEDLALAAEADRAPPMAEAARVERADEGDLQSDVEDHAEDHRADDRDRDVAPGVLALAAELDRLLEAKVGEDDAARRDRQEDPFPAEWHEAPTGGEVARVERRCHEREDGDEGDRE